MLNLAMVLGVPCHAWVAHSKKSAAAEPASRALPARTRVEQSQPSLIPSGLLCAGAHAQAALRRASCRFRRHRPPPLPLAEPRRREAALLRRGAAQRRQTRLPCGARRVPLRHPPRQALVHCSARPRWPAGGHENRRDARPQLLQVATLPRWRSAACGWLVEALPRALRAPLPPPPTGLSSRRRPLAALQDERLHPSSAPPQSADASVPQTGPPQGQPPVARTRPAQCQALPRHHGRGRWQNRALRRMCARRRPELQERR
mmetsp:Transcript_19821/g.76073  ORF Transcript_19821/g.76073 Transcript_19821/m.76073 type:complete len:260 (-) Transcript_19821:503-1282(-)